MKEVKISILIGVWKEWIPTLMDDWVVQDFSGGSHCRCGGNSKRTRMRSGAWRCDWIAALSLWNLNRWGVSFHGWAKKVVY